jgi:type II secretory pathway pseudopilin PulG
MMAACLLTTAVRRIPGNKGNCMCINRNTFGGQRAFSLIEALIASTIAALMFGGIVYGYIQSSRNAEWSAYSFAAQSMAIQRLEQARSCKWDPDATPTVDQLTSDQFPTVVWPLDIPMTGSNVVYATNYTTITTISTAPPLKMISVETVWPFTLSKRLYTNAIVTYRAPDA